MNPALVRAIMYLNFIRFVHKFSNVSRRLSFFYEGEVRAVFGTKFMIYNWNLIIQEAGRAGVRWYLQNLIFAPSTSQCILPVE